MRGGHKPYPRSHRIESLVLRGLSPLVSRLCAAVTIRRISLNGDFSIAKVHYAILAGSAKDAHEQLENNANQLRRQLAKSLNMRATPRLLFTIDDEGIALDKMRGKLEGIDLINGQQSDEIKNAQALIDEENNKLSGKNSTKRNSAFSGKNSDKENSNLRENTTFSNEPNFEQSSESNSDNNNAIIDKNNKKQSGECGDKESDKIDKTDKTKQSSKTDLV